jgi:hypothetical protein
METHEFDESEPIRSKDEALDILFATRAELITGGRNVAFDLAFKDPNYEVHSRQVVAEMEARGIYIENLCARWLGAVFARNPHFEWTGRYHEYTDTTKGRNCHTATVKIWRLRPEFRVVGRE